MDVVIDAAGVSQALQLAMSAVRPAGQITKVGWGPQPLGFNLDPMVAKGVNIQGCFSHNWPTWERVIAMLSTGQIDLNPILDEVAPMEKWEENFLKLHEGEYVKVVLRPN